MSNISGKILESLSGCSIIARSGAVRGGTLAAVPWPHPKPGKENATCPRPRFREQKSDSIGGRGWGWCSGGWGGAIRVVKHAQSTEWGSGWMNRTYSRLIDWVYHPTLGLIVMQKGRKKRDVMKGPGGRRCRTARALNPQIVAVDGIHFWNPITPTISSIPTSSNTPSRMKH